MSILGIHFLKCMALLNETKSEFTKIVDPT